LRLLVPKIRREAKYKEPDHPRTIAEEGRKEGNVGIKVASLPRLVVGFAR
jgi:hypothetical protein